MVIKKTLISIYTSIIAVTLTTISIVHPASAVLDWQDEVDVQFTFNPALSVSISEGDIVIPNLGVGTRDDSNEITITVGTNNVAGYQLSATVGNNTTYDTRNLKHDTSATALFSSLDVGSSLAQLTTPSTWGYSTNSGTSYSGLPKYDDTTNVAILNDSDAAGTETTNFLIGAYADQSQLAGDYRNVINFNVVTNVPTVTYTMQNLDSSLCTTSTPTIVVDSRDNEEYKVQRLADGNCWLLDNLRLDLVAHKNDLNSTNTNATNERLAYLKGTSTGTASDKWAMSGVSYWTSSYSFSDPLIAIKNPSDESWNPDTVASVTYGDGSGKIGVYYNYCAASAGTFCWGNGTSYTGSPSSDPKTNTGYDIDGDICPAGWRMPTGGAIATGTIAQGEYRNLYIQYSSATEGQAAAFRNALSTPLSGYFNNGSARGSGGYFWSSTYSSNYRMYYLDVYSSYVDPQDSYDRSNGRSVRCVLNS